MVEQHNEGMSRKWSGDPEKYLTKPEDAHGGLSQEILGNISQGGWVHIMKDFEHLEE